VFENRALENIHKAERGSDRNKKKLCLETLHGLQSSLDVIMVIDWACNTHDKDENDIHFGCAFMKGETLRLISTDGR
jgi:hypothetical protein